MPDMAEQERATELKRLIDDYFAERLDEIYRSMDNLIQTMSSTPPQERRGAAWSLNGSYAQELRKLVTRQSRLLVQMEQATDVMQAQQPPSSKC